MFPSLLGGSTFVFSQVKVSGQESKRLGTSIVLSPVRKSLRHAVPEAEQRLCPLPELLSTTNYAFAPNPAISVAVPDLLGLKKQATKEMDEMHFDDSVYVKTENSKRRRSEVERLMADATAALTPVKK
jgi:hypothetical protein